MSRKFNLEKHQKYYMNSYDKFFCLKPSWLLLAAMVFLCRDFVLSVLSAATAFGGGSGRASDLLAGNRHWSRFVAEAPVLLLFIALAARLPTAHGVIRWIWKRGRVFLAVAAIAQLMLLIKSDDLWRHIGNISFSSFLFVVLELSILAYVLFSRRIKDTFADFPARVDSPYVPVDSKPSSSKRHA